MKKFMTIVLAAAVVFAVAGKVQATTLETKGEIRARLWYLDNYLQDKHSTEFWDQRLRVYMTWPVAEGVTVNARADILEGFWGENKQTPVFDATLDPITGAVSVNQTLLGTQPKTAIAFDWANMQFKWPGTPVTFTIGRQDVAWGLGLAAKADNRDRFKAAVALDGATIVLAYDKNQELFLLHDTGDVDDSRNYVLGVVTSAAGFKMGLLGLIVKNDVDPAVKITRNLVDFFAMGKAGPADIKGEVAYMFGDNDVKAGADVDVTGLGAYLGAFLPAGPVTAGLEATYVSGDDPTTSKNEGAFRSDYHGPFWSVILFNNMDYPGYAGESNTGSDGGVANATAAKASVAAMPMPGLSVYGAVVYATRNEVAAGMDKPMGTELDLVATYAITENVNWTVGGGYLMAGDFYGDVDDPWGAVSAFQVKF